MRDLLLDALKQALQAVEPETSVIRHLRRDGPSIGLGEHRLDGVGAVRVAAIGKAAPAMARGALTVLGDLLVEGVVISDHEEPVPAPFRLMIGDHPFPGDRSLAAGEALLAVARAGRGRDVLVVLVSGGGSSLAELPVAGLAAEDLSDVSAALMAAGAPIAELNCVRRHLSQIKDGGLIEASPGRAVTLLVSDVVDGPASLIASGPTIADGTTPADAVAILRRRLGTQAPGPVVEALSEAPRRDPGAADHPWAVIADGAAAANAARSALIAAGHEARVLSNSLRGEARLEARRWIETSPTGVSIVSGETTVTGATSGSGGRNQEAALAAALAIRGREGYHFAALGTDGVDGPTDAAGAIVDSGTVSRGDELGLDAPAHLAAHDSHPYLDATGDLVRTGPTGNNVGDLWFVVVPHGARTGLSDNI